MSGRLLQVSLLLNRFQDKARREMALERLSVGTEFSASPIKARVLETALDGANPFDQVVAPNRNMGQHQKDAHRRPMLTFSWSLWSFLKGE